MELATLVIRNDLLSVARAAQMSGFTRPSITKRILDGELRAVQRLPDRDSLSGRTGAQLPREILVQ